MPRTPPDPEKSALAALKEAEAEARKAQQEFDEKRQELRSAKAGAKAAAARLTEAHERVETRWMLLVGEATLNAVERQLRDSKGKKQQWFNQLNPVLDTDIKPDDRVLYDNWKQRMQELGAIENRAKSVTDTDAGSDAKDSPKPIVGWKPVRIGDKGWGSQLIGKAVADLPQELNGVPIIVTSSKAGSWEARIEEVVSRDENSVIVRDTGKPEAS